MNSGSSLSLRLSTVYGSTYLFDSITPRISIPPDINAVRLIGELVNRRRGLFKKLERK